MSRTWRKCFEFWREWCVSLIEKVRRILVAFVYIV